MKWRFAPSLGLSLMFLAGCCLKEPELKCVDGVVYAKNGNVWMTANIYREDKCLTLDPKKLNDARR